MKVLRNILTPMMVALALSSCNPTTKIEEKPVTENQEVSLEQEVQILKNDKGDSIALTYFAKGDKVALKLKINQEEHELEAKGSNDKGYPIFTDDEYAWELMSDARSGKLTDKNKVSNIYRMD